MVEQDFYLATFRAFTRITARMKISFMALLNLQTIKEFIISKILDSYTKMKQCNIIQDTWPQLS